MGAWSEFARWMGLHRAADPWCLSTPTVITPAGVEVTVRELRSTDGVPWRRQRTLDAVALEAVEPTSELPWAEAHTPLRWQEFHRAAMREATLGALIPGVIEANGQFVGQINVGGLTTGPVSNCWVGYWVHSGSQGRGIATAAVALMVDHVLHGTGIHRVEATTLEDNVASQAVLTAAGFRREGFLRRNINVQGQWRDHYLYAQTSEDAPRGVVNRLLAEGRLTLP